MIYGFILFIFIILIVVLIVLTGIIYERRTTKMDEKLYTLYHEDKEFKEYVDKYCKARNINLFEALDHRMIRIFAKERTK